MIKKSLILIVLMLSVLLIGTQCKIIDFNNQSYFVTVTLERTLSVNSSNTSFSETAGVNLADVYAGIDANEMEGVSLINIELTVIENNTNPNTTATGSIKFEESNSLQPEYTLAGFSNISLADVVNQTLSPFDVNNLLNVDEDGVTKLKELAAQTPPPNITFMITGTVNNPPVDFSVNLVITMQLELKQ